MSDRCSRSMIMLPAHCRMAREIKIKIYLVQLMGRKTSPQISYIRCYVGGMNLVSDIETRKVSVR